VEAGLSTTCVWRRGKHGVPPFGDRPPQQPLGVEERRAVSAATSSEPLTLGRKIDEVAGGRQQVRCRRLHLPGLQPARLAAPAHPDEDDYMLVVELALLLRLAETQSGPVDVGAHRHHDTISLDRCIRSPNKLCDVADQLPAGVGIKPGDVAARGEI
jgi:hypothetical protein